MYIHNIHNIYIEYTQYIHRIYICIYTQTNVNQPNCWLNGDLGLLVKSSIHISLGWSTPLYPLLHKTVSGKQTWKIAGKSPIYRWFSHSNLRPPRKSWISQPAALDTGDLCVTPRSRDIWRGASFVSPLKMWGLRTPRRSARPPAGVHPATILNDRRVNLHLTCHSWILMCFAYSTGEKPCMNQYDRITTIMNHIN